LDAGLRVGEVIKLRRSDLLFNNEPVKSLTVTPEQAKGDKERIIPLSSRLIASISELRDRVWPEKNGGDYHFAFFCSDCNFNLTTRQVERILEAAGKKYLGFPVNPHMLRHTFATRLMKATDIRTVQELLGHQHLTSTQVYTHPDFQDLQKAIQQISDIPVKTL